MTVYHHSVRKREELVLYDSKIKTFKEKLIKEKKLIDVEMDSNFFFLNFPPQRFHNIRTNLISCRRTGEKKKGKKILHLKWKMESKMN